MAHIVVGMSGGVDSSVAALLLKRQGHDVTGVFMDNWKETQDGFCTAEQDFADVRAVCDVIGIAYYAISFARQYRERVFRQFLRSYEAGETPNPDVLCNREIKFDALADFAAQIGAEALATGHFARTAADALGGVSLLRGIDAGKDQSYFLHALRQEQLVRAVFPVGGLTKREVRDIAREAGLPTAGKKDSTGICFIGERDFRAFLARYLPARPGDIVTQDGRVVGRHEGCSGYTIGQRKGLRVGGLADGDGAPWFVLGRDGTRNLLIVAQGDDHPALWCSALLAREVTFISGRPPGEHFSCTAKTRYRQSDQACSVTLCGGGASVRFHQPQRAITPGQSVVFYQGEACLGGGVIAQPLGGAAEELWQRIRSQ